MSVNNTFQSTARKPVYCETGICAPHRITMSHPSIANEGRWSHTDLEVLSPSWIEWRKKKYLRTSQYNIRVVAGETQAEPVWPKLIPVDPISSSYTAEHFPISTEIHSNMHQHFHQPPLRDWEIYTPITKLQNLTFISVRSTSRIRHTPKIQETSTWEGPICLGLGLPNNG